MIGLLDQSSSGRLRKMPETWVPTEIGKFGLTGARGGWGGGGASGFGGRQRKTWGKKKLTCTYRKGEEIVKLGSSRSRSMQGFPTEKSVGTKTPQGAEEGTSGRETANYRFEEERNYAG